MNALHSFAIVLILSVVIGLLFLAAARELLGARWARILESMRGVLFWFVAWFLFTAFSYWLQGTTLNKVIRPEPIGLGDPWFEFVHQFTLITTPNVMAGILVFMAAAGGWLVATHFDMLMALIGLACQRTNLSPEEKAGIIQNLISSLISIVAGMIMVWADARVFALRWVIDIEGIETEVQGVPMIARLICWGYFLGFILLSWILHRKYRQFLDAINIEEDDRREPPMREAPQRQTPAHVEERRTVFQEVPRQQTPIHEEAAQGIPWQRIPSPSDGERQRVFTPREPIADDFPVIPEQLPSNGDDEAVLPEHFDPFRTTRRW